MILLNDIVQIFALPDFYALVFIYIVLLDRGFVGAAFVDIDQTGLSVGTDGLFQKTQGCLLITLVCQ